jgi:hypothetical protein
MIRTDGFTFITQTIEKHTPADIGPGRWCIPMHLIPKKKQAMAAEQKV